VSEATLALVGIINHKQTQKELQDYRKSLMQQYLECIRQFDELIMQMKSTGLYLRLKTEDAPKVTYDDVAGLIKNGDEIRSLVIRASALLKATGDTQLIACGWMLYHEALSNLDEQGIWFDLKDYNPIHYFRVGLDFGLQMLADTISNNRPPSKTGHNTELNDQLTETFKKAIIEKYKKDPDWIKRFSSDKVPNRLKDERENDSQATEGKSDEVQSRYNS
jgi:hypothetical protein